MIADTQLQRDVLAELQFEPSVRANDIGVAAHGGVVTLTGRVDSYVEREGAERAALRVTGVKAVANELAVTLPGGAALDDTEVAQAVVRTLESHTSVPADRIRVAVRNGTVTLEGEVDWQFQRDDAYLAVSQLKAVRWVCNLVRVKPHVAPSEVRRKIESALQRSAAVDARHITVETEGPKVVLRGTVRSWAERSDAERAAWSAPGVADVESHLEVEPQLLVSAV